MQGVSLRDSQLRGREPDAHTTAAAFKRFAHGAKQAVANDGDTSVMHFFAGLQRVAAVSEKRGARGFDEQDGGASAKSAEIADVRKMSDEESIRAALRKRKPEPMDSAPA